MTRRRGDSHNVGLNVGVNIQESGQRPVMVNKLPMSNFCSSKMLFPHTVTITVTVSVAHKQSRVANELALPIDFFPAFDDDDDDDDDDSPDPVRIEHGVFQNSHRHLFIKMMESEEKRPEMLVPIAVHLAGTLSITTSPRRDDPRSIPPVLAPPRRLCQVDEVPRGRSGVHRGCHVVQRPRGGG